MLLAQLLVGAQSFLPSGTPLAFASPLPVPHGRVHRAVITARSRAVVCSLVRLITLDLDDTLWPTADVVAQANVVLLYALEAAGAAGFSPRSLI